MQIIDNIPVYGTEIDQGALSQIKMCARTVRGSYGLIDFQRLADVLRRTPLDFVEKIEQKGRVG